MKDGKMTKSQAGRIGGVRKAEKIRSDYKSNPKICKECKSEIPWAKRYNEFCTKSCSATHNNRGVRRHGKPTGNCDCCGAETRNPRFCTNQCQRDFEWKLRKEEIESSGVFPPSNRVVRRYLIEKKGHTCSICEGVEWRGQEMPLEVDHIDGNFENNEVPNLRMVCGNCGMQLPTYKGKNVGNGRWQRRQRYHDGKSY